MKSRTSNSLKNIFWTSFVFFINIILNFIARKIFISFLGADYNGLNSLFTSVISMLSIAELGIGTTILYKLYKPVADNDTEKIKSFLLYYKNCYRIIALIVLTIGIILIPFLDIIVGNIELNTNIYIVYLLFLFESVVSYLLSYKRSILIAYQEERIIKKIHLFRIIFLNLSQILFLCYTKNYYLYLIIKVIFTVLENLIIAFTANKKYNYITQRAKPLEVSEKKELSKRIKAMFFHQSAGFIVNGTDNILISYFFGINYVGFYNNYFLIINSLISLISNIFTAITASIGNLLASSNKEKRFNVYNNINFINFLIVSFICCIFLLMIQDFITWWIGKENLLGIDLVIVMVIYFYFKIMKSSILAFKNAAGIFYEDRYIPIIESVINIFASIIFAHYFGLKGILMGTIVSTLVLYVYSYPKFVYEKLFDKSKVSYYIEHFKYFIVTCIFTIVSYLLNNIIIFDNFYINALKTIIITLIIFITIVYFIFHKTIQYNYVKSIVSNVLIKIKGVIKK